MKIPNRALKKIELYIFAVFLAVNVPLSVMAEGEVITTPPVADSVPITAPTVPPKTYTYDASTGRWNTNLWSYDATTGTYKAIPQPVETTTPPVEEQPAVDSTPNQSTDPLATNPAADQATTSNEPNPATTEQDSDTTIDSNNTTDIDNTLNSSAQTGNATVISNTLAKDAASGDASATAAIVNNVNSVLSTGDNQKAADFTTDVMGDVNGDILLQPMLLKALLESGSTSSTDVDVLNDNTITNNVNLQATSGNAGVVGNTKAGSATSGTANTVANVVNIINSMVAANQSFIGTINIYGNLNGDILIAPDFIPQLIASNGITEVDPSTKLSIDSSDLQSVINNVSLAAESGKAVIADNTKAGSATTGDANTNVVIFNLSGHEIVASNSLLVFVNVLGKWVGVIVDAPAGSTAAAIGSGVKSDITTSPDLTIVSNNTNQITNNITLSSKSGNATVAKNTSAGNATSGDATASVNIANITNSGFGLSGWFGMLFINVFGNWFGSFGINTAAGDPVVDPQTPKDPPSVIAFVPTITSSNKSNVTIVAKGDSGLYVTSTQPQPDTGKVLGAAVTVSDPPVVDKLPSNSVNIALIAASVLVVAIAGAWLNRIRLIRGASQLRG